MNDDNIIVRGEKRAVSICLVDFRISPTVVRSRFPDLNMDVKEIGERRGANQTVPYNFVAFWLPMNALEPWDHPIEQLVDKLGGWKKLKALIAEISPREAWLRIDAPMLGSPYIETNGLSASIISSMSTVGLAFELGVRDYHDEDPTHHPAHDKISTS
jgi:hypothetical protein